MILIKKHYLYYNFHENASPFHNMNFSKIFWVIIYLKLFILDIIEQKSKKKLTLNCKLSSIGSIYISKHLWGKIYQLSWCLLKNSGFVCTLLIGRWRYIRVCCEWYTIYSYILPFQRLGVYNFKVLFTAAKSKILKQFCFTLDCILNNIGTQ